MKLLVVLFLAGFALASAVPLNSFENVDLQVNHIDDFLTDLAFAADDRSSFDDVKKQLRERLDNFLHKIKDAIEHGKTIKEDVLEKVKEIREKMKNLHLDLDGKSHELLDKIREKGREFLRKILERMGLSKRDVGYHVEAILQAEDDKDMIAQLKSKFQEIVKKVKDAFESGKSIKDGLEKLEQIRNKLKEYNIDIGDFGGEFLQQLKDKVRDYWNKLKERLGSKRSADIDVFDMFDRLKKLIKEKFDPERLKEVIEKYFGKRSEIAEQLISLLKEGGEKRKQKILEWIERILGEKEEGRRSISDVYHKVREYFRELNIELKERFSRFGEWVKNQYQDGLEKSKDRLENVKRIAQEFLHDTRQISKDVAGEALDFFREYKKDLGIVFEDIRDKARRILKED